MVSKKEISHWIVILLVIGLFVLSYIIIKSMLKPLISATLLSYIFYPLYKKLKEGIKSKIIASLIVIAIILIGSGFLISILVNSLVKEVGSAYTSITVLLNEIKRRSPIDCIATNCTLSERFFSFLASRPTITRTMNEQLVKMLNELLEKVKNMIFAIPNFIISTIFILFITFFMLIDGEKIYHTIKEFIPLDKKRKDEMIEELRKTTNSVLFGQVIVSLVQGITGGIGLFIGAKIFGIPNSGAIIWGSLMAIASLIPVVGTGLVWIPLGLLDIIRGLSTEGPAYIWYGIYIIIWGALAVANIDGLIRSKFVSQRTSLHPIVVLVSVIGGLHAFGFTGIFIGPIIISSLLKTIQLYQRIKDNEEEEE